MSETPRVRWRMTLQELCHRTGATPADLERWARLGALGPRWKETTENRWRHITRAAATRAVIMRRLVDTGMTEEAAAGVADSSADTLMRGDKLTLLTRAGRMTLDPALLDLP